jgi:hypothetical protein
MSGKAKTLNGRKRDGSENESLSEIRDLQTKKLQLPRQMFRVGQGMNVFTVWRAQL